MTWWGPHKGWSMWFNRCTAKNLTYSWHPEKPAETQVCLRELWDRCCMAVVSSCYRNACQVPQRAQPRPCLPASNVGTQETAGDVPEEGGGDDAQVIMAPLTSRGWYTCWLMAHTEGSKRSMRANPKKCRSPDWDRNLTWLKPESLVIVNQNVTVNTFPALYTPPVTPWEWAAKEAV